MNEATYKAVSLRPLTGPMDSRSNPEDVPPLSFRMKLNFDVNRDDKLARAPGWEKLLSQTPYANQDSHDQGDCLDVTPVRQPITFLYEATSSFGIRRLLRGTQSTLAVLSESTGNWTTLARGFGGSAQDLSVRWTAAQSGNTLLFTNNFDKPQSYTLGTLPSVCGDNVVQEVTELNTLKVTRAGVVASFSGCLFLMDVTQDGSRFQSRVRWSGVNAPTRWVPAVDTVANFQDLPYTETILAAVELQQNLIIFTDRSIYRAYVSGTSFGFTRVYTEPLSLSKCLTYPQSLVSDGKSLWWLGRDEFYRWDLYLPEPEATEWLWRSANLVFDSLDPTCCNGPIGWFIPDDTAIYWSFPKSDSGCLNFRTIKANIRVGTTSLIDHGFTAACNFRSDARETLNEWLTENCTTDFIGLCAQIGDLRVEETCVECNQAQLAVVASAEDYCLKQLGTAFSREMCLNAATGEGGFSPDGSYEPFEGEYEQAGYFSMVRAMAPLGLMSNDKIIKSLLLDPTVADLLGPANYWRLRIGTAPTGRDCNPAGNALAFFMPGDPLLVDYQAEFETDEDCGVLWQTLSLKEIRCPDTQTVSQYRANAVRPVNTTRWAFLSRGRFNYWELSIIAKDADGKIVPPVGAELTLSRVELMAAALPV